MHYKIVYMGTPDFAVPTLLALHHANHHIPLVVTQPDRPKGRGRKYQPPPVKKAARDLGLNVVQPESIGQPEFILQIKQLEPDFLIVTAFGQLLPQNLLAIPKYGAINIHASLLPGYRGPAPIQWAIINGEKETGVTTMMMNTGLDTGDILLTRSTAISHKDTSQTLYDRLSELGAQLILETLQRMTEKACHPKPQDHSQATYAPLLRKEDGRINWKKPAIQLDAFIRGMNPWPGAFTFFGNNRLKIFSAKPIESPATVSPGTVIRGFEGELRVQTGKDALMILEIQGSSGKRMGIENYLRGHSIPPGTQFS